MRRTIPQAGAPAGGAVSGESAALAWMRETARTLRQGVDAARRAQYEHRTEGRAISEAGRSLAVARTEAETALFWIEKAIVEESQA